MKINDFSLLILLYPVTTVPTTLTPCPYEISCMPGTEYVPGVGGACPTCEPIGKCKNM